MINEDVTVILVDSKTTPKIRAICPYCNEENVFEVIDNSQDLFIDLTTLCDEVIFKGYRRCSLSNCQNEFCFSCTCEIEYSNGFNEQNNPETKITEIKTLPANLKFIINTSIPENILSVFQEAQKCYTSDFFLASAIMIRKTLELVCDSFNIKKSNLELRLDSLSKIEKLKDISAEYLHELRIFGNDAAHVNQKKYEFTAKELSLALNALNNLLNILFDNKKELYIKNINDLRKCQQV